MAGLRAVFVELGVGNVETFIASGNVIFESDAADIRALENEIENRLLRALGYEVNAFVRTGEELGAVARYEPFQGARLATALASNVAFLSEPPAPPGKKLILALQTEIDDFQVHGREVYWLCQTRQSDSKFNNTRFEKLLGARATWRGMNTIRRLAAKYLRS
jgi:uncharacterized protein (DUF1697 family)